MTLSRLILFTLLPISLQTLPAIQTVESQIESVSLFRDGARITRVAQFDAAAGKTTLRFENLPTNVNLTALQANIGDAAGVIRNAKIFLPEDPKDGAAVLDLEKKLAQHQREVRAIQEEAEIAKARIRFVEAMSASFSDGYGEISENGETLTVEQGLKTWELVDATRREALLVIEDANQRLNELSKQEIEIQQNLREAREKQQLTQSVAEVEIDLDSPQPLTLSVTYQALAAHWQPQYELRAEPQNKQLEFGYFATVWQQTGEDWTNVELSLHTNQTNRRGNVPELSPMNLHREEVGYYSRGAMERKQTLMQDSSYNERETAAPAPPPPSRQTIAVSASTVSFQVTLPSQATVPSSKNETMLTVTSKVFDTEFWSETVPRLQLDAYLRAKSVNSLELPILPGLGLAFVDGKLSSKVTLDKTLPGEELELSLGADANILVKRIEGAQKDENSGFIDKTVTLRRSYTNTVTSYHPVDHKIVVVDQFPIATDAKIEVTRESPNNPAIVVKEENKDNGIFQWEAIIEPQGTLSFATEYTIVHPRDWTIVPAP